MYKVYVVNAFITEYALSGNPAAICILSAWPSEETMQAVAEQHNLSETAFVVSEPDGTYRIRWFTPTVEIDLCGHATLAAAHVLFEHGYTHIETIVFQSASGPLSVSRQPQLTLNFPVRALPLVDAEPYKNLLTLDIKEVYSNTNAAIFLCSDENEVQRYSPEFAKITELNESIIYVTASSQQFDFVCRVFAPSKGIPEDPVTGSAYTSLAPLWAEKLNKRSLLAKQVSKRGGEVHLTLGDNRVNIAGRATTILIGHWQLEI